MSRSLTIFLGLMAVAALVFLVIIEPRTHAPETEAAIRKGQIASIEPGKVRVLRITNGDDTLEMQRRGGSWQLGVKSKDRADQAVVERLLQDLADLPFLDRIPAGDLTDEALKTYGLDKPKRTIVMEADKPLEISLGNDAAVEDRLYIRTSASGDVFLVSDKVFNEAFREAGDFRDRRLTNLNPEQLDRVVIRRDDGEIELVQDATGWKITKPLHTRADPAAVEKFLNQILGLRILDYVGEDSGDLSVQGLLEGHNEISFFTGGDTRPQTLRLGRKDDGGLFGQFTARDSIYRLPKETFDLLAIKPDALRDRHLIALNPDVVDKIRIRSPAGELALLRTASGWDLQHDGQRVPANEEVVHALWTAISETEATSFAPVADAALADLGLAPPACSIEFLSVLSENTPESRAGEQLLAGLAFGKPLADQVPVRLSDSPEIATVPANLLEAIPLEASSWQGSKK